MNKKWAKVARPRDVGPPMSEAEQAEMNRIWLKKYAPAKRDHHMYPKKLVSGRVGGT